MIKGRYVAIIVMDFKIDENTLGLLPFDELKRQVTNGELDNGIVAILSEEFGGLCSIGLTKQYADLYHVDGGAENA